MDIEGNGKKSRKAKVMGTLVICLRLATMFATITAALLMGLNKQTKRITVAMVGTTPLIQTLTAKFNHTPAFVYFVIANAIASVYNLLVLSFGFLLSKSKGYSVMVHFADMAMMVLVATAAAAATSMAELGKNGNVHARWIPICDKFGEFCHRGGLALVAAFIGAALFIILNAHSIIALHNRNATQI